MRLLKYKKVPASPMEVHELFLLYDFKIYSPIIFEVQKTDKISS